MVCAGLENAAETIPKQKRGTQLHAMDANADERKVGMRYGIDALSQCSELWLCGSYISEGMQAEIDYANKHHITIR